MMFKDRQKQSVIIQFIAMPVSGGGERLIGKQQGIKFWKVKIFFVLIIDQTLDCMNTYNYKKNFGLCYALKPIPASSITGAVN